MGLRIVYGRAGTGKSWFCYDEIKKQVKTKKNIYIITPEQFSFTAEKKLMETLEDAAAMNVEVLTFGRMAHRVMQEVGGVTNVPLSLSGKTMLLSSILHKQKEKLKFLGKTDKNVDVIATMITELKKHDITVEQLQESMGKIEDPYLQYKINDVSLLYQAFESAIQENYIDENDRLTILAEALEQTDMFQNAIFYIDEFVGFTSQEYNIIEKLLYQAERLTITICADQLQPKQKYMPEADVFYPNRVTRNRLIDIATKNHIEIEDDVYLEKVHRYHNKELNHLEKAMGQSQYDRFQEKPEHIHLFLASNPYSEMEMVAKSIIQLVREKQYRYKDIAIITKNIENDASLAKAIFSQYEIPIFIDEKKTLSENILVQYIVSLLEIYSKNWSHEAMFGFIKNGLSGIENKERFLLENYCLKWGITRNKWYMKDWEYEDDNEEINELRRKIAEPIIQLQEKLGKRKTVEQMTKAVYEFLIDNQIPEKLEEKIKRFEGKGQRELANEYATSWKVVLDVLDELVSVLKDEPISFERYLQILKVGLSSSGLGKIPATLDQVIMGDVDRSRSHKVKAIFVIGMNDGVFPSVNRQEGFLDDENREQLRNIGVELAQTTKERLQEDNFNIYKAFTTTEEELYLSYSSADNEGKSLRAATIISKIKKIYPQLEEISDMIEETQGIYTKQVTFEELLTNLRKWQDGEELSEQWQYLFSWYHNEENWKKPLEDSIKGMYYTNLPRPIHAEKVEKLYGDILKTSVSRLEQYRSCPFSFYLKYGLGIDEKEAFQIESVDTGSFMHDVIDEFFTVIQTQDIRLKDITEEELQEIIHQIIEDKLQLKKNYIFTSRKKYQVLVHRLEKLLTKSMKYMIQAINNSDFEILGHEVEFKEGKHYPPIRLQLEDGKQVEIIGKIDRIDVAQTEGKQYLRIIDYKSSVKNIDLNEVVAGLQIQLLTYLDAATKVEEKLPAGVLYFNLIDPIIKANKDLSEEELEEEIKKKFKMQGLILADVNVVKMMDHNLEKGASSVIPAYLDKEGNISKGKSSAITREEFTSLQNYIHKTIKQIAKEIFSGKIDVAPYYSNKKKKSPCDYCKYHSICQFDEANPGNDYRYIPNENKEAILEKIKKG